MPIKIPNNLPAVKTLEGENIFVMTETRAITQDIRPLKILLLNLMPKKIETETQFSRLLGNTPLQVELELIHTKSHKSKNVAQEHLLAFYKTFEDVKNNYYDGFIITGAPVEQMEFEAVFHPERVDIITTDFLERELPEIEWRGGHSGVMLDKEVAVRLELIWRDYVGCNKSLYLPRAAKNDYYDSRSDIDKAIEFASKAHAADYDLDGNPTILHSLAVGMMGKNDTERIVGFLHDVVEDTKYDFDDLIDEGFSEEVIAALRLLTHDKQTEYMDYINNICTSGNLTAIHVKMNDLKHNLARGKEGGYTRCVERHTLALAHIESYIAGMQ